VKHVYKSDSSLGLQTI